MCESVLDAYEGKEANYRKRAKDKKPDYSRPHAGSQSSLALKKAARQGKAYFGDAELIPKVSAGLFSWLETQEESDEAPSGKNLPATPAEVASLIPVPQKQSLTVTDLRLEHFESAMTNPGAADTKDTKGKEIEVGTDQKDATGQVPQFGQQQQPFDQRRVSGDRDPGDPYDSDPDDYGNGSDNSRPLTPRAFFTGALSHLPRKPPTDDSFGDFQAPSVLEEKDLREFKLALPEPYDGSDRTKAREFLSRCKLHFVAQPKTYGTHLRKISFVLSLCKGGTAGRYAAQYVDRMEELQRQGWNIEHLSDKRGVIADFGKFQEDFLAQFGEPNPGETARFNLEHLKQGDMNMTSFITMFKDYAGQAGYDETALIQKFKFSLRPAVAAKLTERVPPPKDIKEWYTLAQQVDLNFREAQALRNRSDRPFEPTSDLTRIYGKNPTSTTKVRAGNIRRLTREERAELLKIGGCFRCRKPGHMARDCPEKKNYDPPKARATSGKSTLDSIAELVKALTPEEKSQASGMLDF